MPKDLTKVSTEELEAELARRQSLQGVPEPLENPDFSELIECVKNGVQEMINKQYEDDDFSHFVYEAAMEAVYGKGFFDWRNKQNFG